MSYERFDDNDQVGDTDDVAVEDDQARAYDSLQSQEPGAADPSSHNPNRYSQIDGMTIQESMESNPINLNTRGQGQNQSQFQSQSAQNTPNFGARSEPLTRATSINRPIQVLQQNSIDSNDLDHDPNQNQNQNQNRFKFDPNSPADESQHSLITNPYISIDKQTAREKQAKEREKESQQKLLSHSKNSQSGSIQAPTPPSRLVRQYSPYTPRGAVMLIQDKIQPGSIKGSIFNIVIATVGGGILSLPYGVRYIGLVGGLLLTICSGLLAYFSNDLQLIVCQHMNPNVKPSFKTMSELAGGRCLATFTQIVLLIQMFGAFISYQVAAGGLVDLCYSVVFNSNTNIYVPAVLGMTVLIMYPLSLLNSMAKLRFTSLLGITCSSYLSLVIFLEYFLQCGNSYDKEPLNKGYLPHSTTVDYTTCFWQTKQFFLPMHSFFPFNNVTDFITGFLTAYPLFIFSFVCNQYALPIYVELQRKSRRRMQKVLRRGFSIVTVLYILSSCGGFLSFLFATCGNIILNNYSKHYDVVVAAIAISISMILTNPMTTFAWRQNFSLLIWHHRNPLPRGKHLFITTIFVAFATIIAISVTDIATVFGLLGATTYPTVGFVLPGIFFIQLVPNVPKYRTRRIFAWFCILFLGSVSAASFIYQIYTFIVPTHDKCNAMQDIVGPDW